MGKWSPLAIMVLQHYGPPRVAIKLPKMVPHAYLQGKGKQVRAAPYYVRDLYKEERNAVL